MAVAHALFARSGGSKTRDGTRRGGHRTRAASRTVGGRVANAGTARGESHRLATMGSCSRPQGRGARMKLSLSAKGRRADARERDARAGRASAPPSSQRCEARYPARVPGGREHVGGRGAKSPDRAESPCAQAPVSKQKQPHGKKCQKVHSGSGCVRKSVESRSSNRGLHARVRSSTVHNGQEAEAARVSVDGLR